MNTIQKATAAVMALAITLAGAVLSTAPMTLAGSRLVASSTAFQNPSQSLVTIPGQTGLKDAARTGTDLG